MKDLAKRVGQGSYPWPHDFIEEAIQVGTSTRVSSSSVPILEGPGIHRLAFIHPKVIVTVKNPDMTMWDLCLELWTEYAEKVQDSDFFDRTDVSLDDFDPVEAGLISEDGRNTLALCYLLREAERANRIKTIEEKYQIKYHEHYFMYTYLERVEWIAPQDAVDEDGFVEIPDEIKGRGVVPVIDVYQDTGEF